MAETLISPGSLLRENDQSFIQGQPIEAGAAILGPTVKGPVGIPTLVTSFSEFNAIFGGAVISGSQQYSYLTSISANNYFQQGGTSLLVTRVVSGSFSPAFTSGSASSILNSSSNEAFILETISQGEIMNSSGSLDSSGSLINGTEDNIRWEVVNSNPTTGVFSLLIRRGNDNNRQKVILETWSNLSLDPKAPNYIERVIGNTTFSTVTDDGETYIQSTGNFSNKSKYVIVKSVLTPTPDYFDNNGIAKTEFTGSIPVNGSGSFKGAIGKLFGAGAKFYEEISAGNIQGLTANHYTSSINLLNNKDEYIFNVITAPGLNSANHSSATNLLLNLAESRQDCLAVIDLVGFGSNISTVQDQSAAFDSSYGAAYWPWLQTIDPNTGQAVWIPASTMIPGVYAFTDRSTEAWFAPAGLTRGALGNVTKAERKLTTKNRDALYTANINPIASFPGFGVVIFGQKTLQKRASALDRISSRRLLIELKNFISQIANTLVFEQNTSATRNSFLNQVNPYLESVQQRQGLFAFNVVMDDTNNTGDVIDRNELVGQIFIQPTRTAEFIILDFNVLPTGVEFS
jgi:hypothetical protein